MRYRFGLMFAALWWGSLTALGFVFVPSLFVHLPSAALAGQTAAKLFTAQAWISIACAMLLLMVFNQKEAVAHDSYAQAAIKLIVAGLLLAVLVEFGVAPKIISARAEGGNLKFWHALGSMMYLGQWLFAGFALWRLIPKTDTFTAEAQSTQRTAE